MPVNKLYCGRCNNEVGRNTTGVQCEVCKTWFHAKCVDLGKASAAALSVAGASWRCSICRSPVDRRASRLFLPTPAPDAAVPTSAVTLEAVYGMIKEIRSDMRSMNSRYEEMVESMQFCSQRVSDFEVSMKRLDDRLKIINKLNDENLHLKKQVTELSGRVADLEQYSRRSNLEVQGVPEKDGEDLVAVVGSLSEFLGVPVSSVDVDAVHRVPHGPDAAGTVTRRLTSPKSIVIRFCSRLKRDNFLAAAKLKRRSAPAGSPPGLAIRGVSDRCFINEHLTPANKVLFGRARRVAKEKNYKYVWTRNCQIFVRKSDDARPLPIRCEADVDRM
nr:uncharacterized protein LOC111417224 [Onthophagus taurus]